MRFFVSVVLMVFFEAPSWAAFGNYNSILIGDQAAGMGGAYTAMTNDASALAWYNPAGLAFLKGQSFSAAVGIYKKFDTRYGDAEDFTKAGLRVNQGFFRALPSSTGSVVRFSNLKDWTTAFSIVVPEYETFKGAVHSTATNNSTLSLVDESLWVGFALARKISSTESMGLSVYYTARSLSKSVTDRTSDGINRTVFQEDRASTQNGIVPILGYHLSFAEKWKLGLSWRGPMLLVAGSGTYFSSKVDSSTSNISEVTHNDLSSKAKVPQKYTLGLAWQALEEVILSADFSYYGQERYSDVEQSDISEYIVHRNMWNWSFGSEVALRKWLKIRTGFFTNFSSHPDPDPNLVKGQGDHIDQLGFSANAAFRSGAIEYTFGGYYTGGHGRSVQRIDQTYVVVPRTSQVFTMLIGTSYLF